MRMGRSELLAGCMVTWTDGRITLSGDIDELNADAIADRMCARMTGGNTISTVDLTGVTFFSAAGIRMLAKIGVAARHRDAIVHVTCSPKVWRIVALCGGSALPGLVLDQAGRHDPGATSGHGAAL